VARCVVSWRAPPASWGWRQGEQPESAQRKRARWQVDQQQPANTGRGLLPWGRLGPGRQACGGAQPLEEQQQQQLLQQSRARTQPHTPSQARRCRLLQDGGGARQAALQLRRV
jgi:hypothetical protein